MTQTASANNYRTERYATTEGYAVGTTDGGEWLTILGSHWETIPLFSTAEAAEAWWAEKWATNMPGEWYQPITRKVRRAGGYFRIID